MRSGLTSLRRDPTHSSAAHRALASPFAKMVWVDADLTESGAVIVTLSYVGSAASLYVTFTLADLQVMKPGQVRVYDTTVPLPAGGPGRQRPAAGRG